MTVQRITLSKDYVQDEHQRAFMSLSNSVDLLGRQERTFFAGVYGPSNQTDTIWHSFDTTFSGANYYAGWIADKPGSVIAVSILDTSTPNAQQYGVSFNSILPTSVITRAQTGNITVSYPLGQLTFKQGDLIALFARNSTTASTNFAATGHITVSVGA